MIFIYFLIDFHKNSQLIPVGWLQFVVNIVIVPLAVPVPLFSHEFHSEFMNDNKKGKV